MVGPTFYSKNMQYNSLYTQISNEPQRCLMSLYFTLTKKHVMILGHSSHSIKSCQIFSKSIKEIILVWTVFFSQVLGILSWVPH